MELERAREAAVLARESAAREAAERALPTFAVNYPQNFTVTIPDIIKTSELSHGEDRTPSGVVYCKIASFHFCFDRL